MPARGDRRVDVDERDREELALDELRAPRSAIGDARDVEAAPRRAAARCRRGRARSPIERRAPRRRRASGARRAAMRYDVDGRWFMAMVGSCSGGSRSWIGRTDRAGRSPDRSLPAAAVAGLDRRDAASRRAARSGSSRRRPRRSALDARSPACGAAIALDSGRAAAAGSRGAGRLAVGATSVGALAAAIAGVGGRRLRRRRRGAGVELVGAARRRSASAGGRRPCAVRREALRRASTRPPRRARGRSSSTIDDQTPAPSGAAAARRPTSTARRGADAARGSSRTARLGGASDAVPARSAHGGAARRLPRRGRGGPMPTDRACGRTTGSRAGCARAARRALGRQLQRAVRLRGRRRAGVIGIFCVGASRRPSTPRATAAAEPGIRRVLGAAARATHPVTRVTQLADRAASYRHRIPSEAPCGTLDVGFG